MRRYCDSGIGELVLLCSAAFWLGSRLGNGDDSAVRSYSSKEVLELFCFGRRISLGGFCSLNFDRSDGSACEG